MSRVISEYQTQQFEDGLTIVLLEHKGWNVTVTLEYNEMLPEYYQVNVLIKWHDNNKGRQEAWGLAQCVKAKDFDDNPGGLLWLMVEATIGTYRFAYKI